MDADDLKPQHADRRQGQGPAEEGHVPPADALSEALGPPTDNTLAMTGTATSGDVDRYCVEVPRGSRVTIKIKPPENDDTDEG